MQEGVASAYKAVMKPAEGTVLTVSRLAAKRALRGCAEESGSLEQVLEAAISEGYDHPGPDHGHEPGAEKGRRGGCRRQGLPHHPGGHAGRAVGASPCPKWWRRARWTRTRLTSAALSAEEITFAFDTVFIVRKNKPDVCLDPLRTYLNSIGDSLVIGEDDEAFKVHVHTNIPGDALTEAQKYGTLELAKIENMRTQADDLAAGRKAQSTDDLDAVEEELESAGEGGHVVAQPDQALRLPGGVRRRRPGLPLQGPGRRRRGLRRTDHEPLHREHPGRDRQDSRGDRLCAAQQLQHHHGRPAVRRA